MCTPWKKVALFLFCFCFRFFYGVNLTFGGEDERAVYLLGLEWATLGKWPFFGADIIHTTQQIPGALQSLLVGAGFSLLRIPEAPFIIVNFLSLGGLWLLARYLSPRISSLSFEWIFLFLASLPWTLEISTHVYNPSYLLLPAILFFIGFFETMPGLQRGIWSPWTCFFWFGISLGSIFQLHMSWPLLIPLAAYSLWTQRRAGFFKLIAYGTLGFAIPFSLVIPTFFHYGWREILSIGGDNTGWNGENARYLLENLVRMLFYGGYETWMFLGETAKERWNTLQQGPYLIPFFITLTLVGAFQLCYFLYAGMRALQQGTRFSKWVFRLFGFLFIESYGIFLISLRPPISRNFYLLIPVSLCLSLLAIEHFATTKKRLQWVKAIICMSVVYHCLLAYNRLQNFPKHTLYQERNVILKALSDQDPYEFEKPRYPEFH